MKVTDIFKSEVLIDAFFERFDGRTYYMLDKTVIRERKKRNELPYFFSYAMFSLAVK
jgi:hypothetical protein